MCVCLILAPCRTRTCVNHGSNTRLLFVALLRSHRRLGNASPLVWCEQGLAPPLLAAELAGVPLGIRVDLGEELVQGSTLRLASTDVLSAAHKSKGGCRSRRAWSCWPPAGPKLWPAAMETTAPLVRRATTHEARYASSLQSNALRECRAVGLGCRWLAYHNSYTHNRKIT